MAADRNPSFIFFELLKDRMESAELPKARTELSDPIPFKRPLFGLVTQVTVRFFVWMRR